MADRYQVLPRSDSGHCCFDATVIDTTAPTMSGDMELRPYTWVCECFEIQDAERIAAALNASPFGAKARD